MTFDDLMQRIAALDEEASLRFDNYNRLHLVIAGGGALILMGLIPRATLDIDAISVSKQLVGLMSQYDININVQAYVGNFPQQFESRLVPVDFTGKIIDVFTVSLEDIVIAKLYASRDKDLSDIKSPAVLSALDWNLLHELATSDNEAKSSALNERSYQEFLIAYNDYERRFRK